MRLATPHFSITPNAGAHLDAVRSLAALAVVISHFRNLFFVDYSELNQSNLLVKALYYFTGFGHQAVMIFFVLSGLLISLGIYRKWTEQRWSWKSYLIQRMSRLAIALWPALVLTFLLDWTGMQLFGSAQIYGGDELGGNLLPTAVANKTSWLIYLGNAFFLQNIATQTAGSNSPLWSLTNEFWYYLLFPLFIGILLSRSLKARITSLFLAYIISFWVLPSGILLYFSIWLMGAGITFAWIHFPVANKRRILLGGLGSVVFLGALMLSRLPTHYYLRIGIGTTALEMQHDFLVGIATSALLFFILYGTKFQPSKLFQSYRSTAQFFSNFSYSLYIIHLPFVVFLRAWLVRDARWQPTWENIFIGMGLVCSTVLFAYLFSLVTEAQTNGLRKKLEALFTKKPPLPVRPEIAQAA